MNREIILRPYQEKCFEEAKKYNTIKEWIINNRTSYDKARQENWYEECKSHMT